MNAQLKNILEYTRLYRSDILPSEWAEQNRVLTTAESKFHGPYSYELTPYLKEIVDMFHPSSPINIGSVMKGAQIGFSRGAIENAIGYIISQQPGNILYLVGHDDAVSNSMDRLEQMIDGSGLRHLIFDQSQRARKTKSGDTNKAKHFGGGQLKLGQASNHKTIRQYDARYGLYDDIESAKRASKESGDTVELIMQRHKSFGNSKKVLWISTPELKESSIIEPLYLLGDQRKWHVPCPKCGTMIVIEWSIEIDGTDGKETGGMYWKEDPDTGLLIRDSVGYVCQSCGKFFTDQNKLEMVQAGKYIPTATPFEENRASWHIPALLAPPGMDGWVDYVSQYMKANPKGQPRDEQKWQTFVNVVLGETYEKTGEEPKATHIMGNTRKYDVGTVPEQQSIRDGNGDIVLLTLAADLNGTMPDRQGRGIADARLDYEIVAWSANGQSYSVQHGSIGTFVPREGSKKHKENRERWTYEEYKPNSVWPELTELLEKQYATDTGREMPIYISGIDCGHYTSYAYAYLDKANTQCIGLRGEKATKYMPTERNAPWYKKGRDRENYFLLDVGLIKDRLSDYMQLHWDADNEDHQPVGFMNFPQPDGGLYAYSNYFEHFESEHRVIDKDKTAGAAARWVKKSSLSQNHIWDCRVYNMALRELALLYIAKDLNLKSITWKEYVSLMEE